MKSLVILFALCFAFSANAQYVKTPRTITTEDLNQRAQQLTQQCVYLHIAGVGSDVLGVILIGVGVSSGGNTGYSRRRGASPNGGFIVAGGVCILGGAVCEILEWIKVSHAHNILSIGNPKLGFNSGANGLGLAYNF